MKICILLCGLPKNLDFIINHYNRIFQDNIINFYICTNNQCEKISTYHNIIKTLVLLDKHNDDYRNCLNYCYKIVSGLKIIDSGYDLYIISRSDLILLNFDLEEIGEDLYFNNNHMNQFTSYTENRVNDNIIISKDINKLFLLKDLYTFSQDKINFLDICLFNYLHQYKINYSLLSFKYKLNLYSCNNIVAICGDSGSGKSTLANFLSQYLNQDNTLLLETDRYHKWERGDINYQKFTHLNPDANNLDKMNEDIYNLKLGNEVYQVDYNHKTGKFTNKEKIISKKNIIISGLHTLYPPKLQEITNLKIFMDNDRELTKRWKISRDSRERGYEISNVLEQFDKRQEDYIKYISSQKENADIIIKFIENNKCMLILKSDKVVKKILTFIIKNYKDYQLDKFLTLMLEERENTFEIYKKICEIISRILFE